MSQNNNIIDSLYNEINIGNVDNVKAILDEAAESNQLADIMLSKHNTSTGEQYSLLEYVLYKVEQLKQSQYSEEENKLSINDRIETNKNIFAEILKKTPPDIFNKKDENIILFKAAEAGEKFLNVIYDSELNKKSGVNWNIVDSNGNDVISHILSKSDGSFESLIFLYSIKQDKKRNSKGPSLFDLRFCNNNKENLLHRAAISQDLIKINWIINNLQKSPEFNEFKNAKDFKGNTPIIKLLSLTECKIIDDEALNNNSNIKENFNTLFKDYDWSNVNEATGINAIDLIIKNCDNEKENKYIKFFLNRIEGSSEESKYLKLAINSCFKYGIDDLIIDDLIIKLNSNKLKQEYINEFLDEIINNKNLIKGIEEEKIEENIIKLIDNQETAEKFLKAAIQNTNIRLFEGIIKNEKFAQYLLNNEYDGKNLAHLLALTGDQDFAISALKAIVEQNQNKDFDLLMKKDAIGKNFIDYAASQNPGFFIYILKNNDEILTQQQKDEILKQDEVLKLFCNSANYDQLEKFFDNINSDKNISNAFTIAAHNAAAKGDNNKLKFFIEQDPNIIYKKNDNNKSLLEVAADNGQKETVKFIFRKHQEIRAEQQQQEEQKDNVQLQDFYQGLSSAIAKFKNASEEFREILVVLFNSGEYKKEMLLDAAIQNNNSDLIAYIDSKNGVDYCKAEFSNKINNKQFVNDNQQFKDIFHKHNLKNTYSEVAIDGLPDNFYSYGKLFDESQEIKFDNQQNNKFKKNILDKIDKKKENFDFTKKSNGNTGHSLLTLVAALGNPEHWKKIRNKFNDVYKRENINAEETNFSTLGSPLQVALMANNTSVFNAMLSELKSHSLLNFKFLDFLPLSKHSFLSNGYGDSNDNIFHTIARYNKIDEYGTISLEYSSKTISSSLISSNNEGKTPIEIAIDNNNYALFSRMFTVIKDNLSQNELDKALVKIVKSAVVNDNIYVLQEIFKNQKSVNFGNYRDSNNDNLLKIACINKSTNSLRYLISEFTNVPSNNIVDYLGLSNERFWQGIKDKELFDLLLEKLKNLFDVNINDIIKAIIDSKNIDAINYLLSDKYGGIDDNNKVKLQNAQILFAIDSDDSELFSSLIMKNNDTRELLTEVNENNEILFELAISKKNISTFLYKNLDYFLSKYAIDPNLKKSLLNKAILSNDLNIVTSVINKFKEENFFSWKDVLSFAISEHDKGNISIDITHSIALSCLNNLEQNIVDHIDIDIDDDQNIAYQIDIDLDLVNLLIKSGVYNTLNEANKAKLDSFLGKVIKDNKVSQDKLLDLAYNIIHFSKHIKIDSFSLDTLLETNKKYYKDLKHNIFHDLFDENNLFIEYRGLIKEKELESLIDKYNKSSSESEYDSEESSDLRNKLIYKYYDLKKLFNEPDDRGYTPVQLAAISGNKDLYKSMKSICGENIEKSLDHNLAHACVMGGIHVENDPQKYEFENLIDKNPKLASSTDKHGAGLLTYSVHSIKKEKNPLQFEVFDKAFQYDKFFKSCLKSKDIKKISSYCASITGNALQYNDIDLFKEIMNKLIEKIQDNLSLNEMQLKEHILAETTKYISKHLSYDKFFNALNIISEYSAPEQNKFLKFNVEKPVVSRIKAKLDQNRKNLLDAIDNKKEKKFINIISSAHNNVLQNNYRELINNISLEDEIFLRNDLKLFYLIAENIKDLNPRITDQHGNTFCHKFAYLIKNNINLLDKNIRESFVNLIIKSNFSLLITNEKGQSVYNIINGISDDANDEIKELKSYLSSIRLKEIEYKEYLNKAEDIFLDKGAIHDLESLCNQDQRYYITVTNLASKIADKILSNESLNYEDILNDNLQKFKLLVENSDIASITLNVTDENGDNFIQQIFKKISINGFKSEHSGIMDRLVSIVVENRPDLILDLFINHHNKDGENVIESLAKVPNSIEIFKKLKDKIRNNYINNGCDLNSILINAASSGDEDLYTYILENYRLTRFKTVNEYGESPLHAAVISGRKAAVETVLKSGADINQKKLDGNVTALQTLLSHLLINDVQFIQKEHVEIVKLLVQSGAEISSDTLELVKMIDQRLKLDKDFAGKIDMNGEFMSVLLDSRSKYHEFNLEIYNELKKYISKKQPHQKEEPKLDSYVSGGIVYTSITNGKFDTTNALRKIANDNINTIQLDFGSDKGYVQQLPNKDQRNYVVTEGTINLNLKWTRVKRGGSQKTSSIKVKINADGSIYEIKCNNKYKGRHFFKGCDIFVGGIPLEDALKSGHWRDNLLKKSHKRVTNVNNTLDIDEDSIEAERGNGVNKDLEKEVKEEVKEKVKEIVQKNKNLFLEQDDRQQPSSSYNHNPNDVSIKHNIPPSSTPKMSKPKPKSNELF